MPSNIRQILNQRRMERQRQQELAIERELDMIQQLVKDGATGEDLMNSASLFQHTSGADLRGWATIADVASKKQREEKKLQETLDPQILSTLGRNLAEIPGPTGRMQPQPGAEAAGTDLAQRIVALQDRPELIPALMSRVGTARFESQRVGQEQLASESRGEALQSRAQQRGYGIEKREAAVKSEAAGIAWGDLTGLDPSPEAVAERLATAGFTDARAAPEAIQRARGEFAAERAKWERSVTGKGLDAKALEARMRLDQEDFPNLDVSSKRYRDHVSLEVLDLYARDPVMMAEGELAFIPTSGKTNKTQMMKTRNQLLESLIYDQEFRSGYQDMVRAQQEGRLAGGALQTGGLMDVLSTLGVQVPEVRVYQGMLFNYAQAKLNAMGQGRASDRDIVFQLQSFPTIAEIGTPNGQAKLDAQSRHLQLLKLAPFSPAIRKELNQLQDKMPSLPPSLRALLADVGSGKKEINDETIREFLTGLNDFSARQKPPMGPAAAPLSEAEAAEVRRALGGP